MKAKVKQPFHSLSAVVVGLAVIAATGLAGYLYTAAEKRSFHTEMWNQLTAVADMKVRQLVAWREQRLGDAKVIQFNPFTNRAVREILDSGRDRGEIEKWLGLLMEAYQYTAASLWDKDHRRRVWLPAGDPANDAERELIVQAMRAKAPLLADLHRDEPIGAVHMALAVPLMSASSPEPYGAVLLRIDPARFLYRLIQSWPTPSRSAETLLVRREGNDVVFLNELRHQRDTALKLRFPVARIGLPAAQGVLGHEGTFEGVDYRGIPVLAVTRGVPGSPWFLVAKVDREEILGPLRQRTHFIAMFFGLAAVTLIAGIIFFWSRQEAEVLRASEVRYRRLFEAAKDGILILDAETGMIVDVNPFLIEMLGFPHEAFLHKSIWELGCFKDIVGNRANFLELQQKGYVRYEDMPLGTADGRRIEVEFVSNVYLVGNKKVIQCNIRDITGRKRAAEAIQRANEAVAQAEARYRLIFNSGSDALFVFKFAEDGMPGPFLEVSDNACRYLGYTREELLRMRVPDIVPPESHPGMPGIVRRLLAEGHLVWEEMELARDGRRIPVEINARVFDLDGSPALISSVRDISERKEAENRYRSIFEGAIEGIYRTSLEGRSQAANPALAKMLGYDSAAEYLSVMTDSAHQVWLDPAERSHFLKLLERDGVVRGYECQFKRRDGTPIWVSVNSRKMCGDDGRTLYNEGFIEDITGRKRAEAERAQLEQRFQQAQKMESIGRLAGGVAHDFNNLLTVINGYSQMLLAKLNAGDPMWDTLTEIHNAGVRAAGLTRQLLAFGRKQVLEPHRLDVNRVVEEMRPMLERLMGEDVEVRVALLAAGGTIHADPHQLEQVVMNLVVNARDAMPDGGKLLLETANVERDESYTRSHPEARVGRYVMLAVSDNGAGMDEETKNRIFEPFFTTKGAGQGTGLGLSMVQGIVAQSGGFINVHSEPGQGTSFKIYLPALAEAAPDDWRPAAVPAPEGKETVLVVEDQAEVRKYTVAALKEYGYRVIQAENAGEALLLCQRERVDLVLTDVVMPNVSGRQLADRLETLQPGIKVLFMSGYTDNVIVHHGVLEGGAKFIQKPFSPEELAGKVRAVLSPPAPAARILVADDEAGVRGFLRKVLEEGGYEVIEAVDGKQALQQARAGHVDLVITDLVMPGQEGIETIRALRREVPGVGIIAISGAFGGQFLKVAQMMGAAAVLNKPVSAELLLARVAEVLKQRRPDLPA
jgi:PAS domain S-box-containing protein